MAVTLSIAAANNFCKANDASWPNLRISNIIWNYTRHILLLTKLYWHYSRIINTMHHFVRISSIMLNYIRHILPFSDLTLLVRRRRR